MIECDLNNSGCFKCIGCKNNTNTDESKYIVTRPSKKELRVKVRGAFTFKSTHELLHLGEGCYFKAVKTIEFDLSEVTGAGSFDSSAFGLLLFLQDKSPNLKFKFLNVKEDIRKLFTTVKLDERITVES